MASSGIASCAPSQSGWVGAGEEGNANGLEMLSKLSACAVGIRIPCIPQRDTLSSQFWQLSLVSCHFAGGKFACLFLPGCKCAIVLRSRVQAKR